MDSKVCSNCKKELTIGNFNKARKGKFGVAAECRECYSKRQKERNNPPNEDINTKKTCTDCNKEFPATTEFFYRHKQCKFGVEAKCKKCINKRQGEINVPVNTDINIKKICIICNLELPATTKYFNREKSGKFGVRGQCKECRNRKNNAKDIPPNTDINIKQTCAGCGKEKPATLNHFYRKKNGKFGVETRCKECENKRKKEINKPANTDIDIKQICTACGKEKPATLDYFYRCKTRKFGVRGECRECFNKRQREINIPINTNVSIKRVCVGCGEEFPATSKHFYKRKSGKFGLGAKCKVCEIKNAKQWQKHNKDKINEYANKRYRTDEQYRIRARLRSNLNRALNKIGQSKNASILDYIGCDIEFLKQYLNSTKDDNWGDIELDIDHIIPQSLYDFTNEEEIKKVYNWRNLRYFPKSDNIIKRDILDMSLVKQYGIDDLLPDF